MLRESELQTSREVAEFTRKRVETGEASVADATQVELEAHILETEILQLSAERSAQIGELRPLLGVATGEELQFTGELSLPGKAAATGVAVETRPDMQAARANIDAARSAAAVARAQKWEDIGVGIAVQSEYAEDAPDGFMRDEFVALRFSLPLPLWNQNSGRIRETEAAAARRQKEADALALTIRSEADAARAEMATFATLIRTIDENLIPQASEIESHLRNANAAGQSTVVEVLRARSRRLLLQRQRLDALRDYHLARVRYESAISPGPRPMQRGDRNRK
jgi:outer membrane protein TolC